MKKVLGNYVHVMVIIFCFLQVSLISCKKDCNNNQPQTLVLQGKGSTDLHIGFLNEQGDISNANAPEFSAAAWTIGGVPVTLRGLFRFDLSSIPASAKITSAHLTLYSNPHPMNGDLVHANSGTNNTMLLQRVTSDWNSSTKWQTQPGTDASTQIVVPHTDQPFLNLLIDVTSQVQTMVKTNNYGWMIKLQNEVYYNIRIFASNKNDDPTKWPKLEVVYTR